MLEGHVERRLIPRVPWQAELQVKFDQPVGGQPIAVIATNISYAGMEFCLPWDHQASRVGQVAALSFRLPGGPVTVQTLVCHERLKEEAGSKPLLHYGVKFLDLHSEHWRAIRAYCQARESSAEAAGTVPEERGRPGGLETLTRKLRKDRPMHLEVLANLHPTDGRIIPGRIEEVGFGGLEIRTRRPVEAGTSLKTRIRHEQIRLDLFGECLWSRATVENPAEYIVGVRIKVKDKTEFGMLRDLILKLVRSAQ